MGSIRARLTGTYGAALLGTLVVFAIVLWSARRAATYDELERHVVAEANLALNIIRQSEQAGQPVTTVRDFLVGPVIAPTLRTLLEGVPDYVLVLDPDGRMLYLSFAARQLDADGLARLQAEGLAAPPSGAARIVTVGGKRLLLAARAPGSPASQIGRVVVAAPTQSAEVVLRHLLATMLVVAPLLLLASLAVAYALASRALKPVDRIINEVQAITDGRSLHRRLPVDDGGDEIARLTITLNEMIERLEKSFSGLRRFTADASHELKTPLAVLRADVERAMNPTTPRPDRLIALEEALQEINRMADLVESLLTLARADEGRFDLHREPVALEPLAREVFETVAILGEAAGVAVSMPTPHSAVVLGDYVRLRQLFLNLGTNAVKYTPRGGRVEIALSRYDRTASFSVRDTGIGISAADLPHIFERFFRSDRARSRLSERGGFGLGLAISQWIAEAHGGSIAVRSRLGRGSTFTVTLPTADEVILPSERDVSAASA